jgi:transaldolase / glucose-6-phosphate isomerase
MMAINPLVDLEQFGQSVWLDYISRSLIDSGELESFIKNDHLKGVTSNPSIFEKAIAKTNDYHQAIEDLRHKDAPNAQVLYENLAIKDIQDACDLLRSTYEKTHGLDGFSSLEVSPHLAFNTEDTIKEGLRLFHHVDRPNLMIKVPGTPEGMAAIRTLIGDGINVNVTLLFSINAYKNAAMAYLLGLRDRMEKGLPIDSVQSVASFFISRIDSKIDPILLRIIKENENPQKVRLAQDLMGTIAIVNAKVAYKAFEEIYQSDMARTLIRKGAHPQRLLWASTSTKNNRYSDVLYVESLIGQNTVNTIPLETLKAFKDHGKASNSLLTDINKAEWSLAILSDLGIDFEHHCQDLLTEGLKLFADAFDQLLSAVDKKLIEVK